MSSATDGPRPSLISFFAGYTKRYIPWIAIALAAIVVFGVMSGAMIGLIHPLFSETLQFDGTVPGAAGLATGAASQPSVEVKPGQEGSGIVASVRRKGIEIRTWGAGIYDRLKERFDIQPDGRGLRSELWFAPLLFLGVFITRSTAQFISGYSFQRIGLGITTDIRNDLYRSILEQSARFHADHTSGELYSRVVSDVSKLQVVVSSRLLDLLLQSVALVVYIVMLLSIHLPLALTCLIAAPVLLIPIVRFGKGMRKTSHLSQERMADLSALLTEGIRGNRVVKAFGMQGFESRRFEKATNRHLRVTLRAQLIAALSSPVVESLAAIGGCALIVSVGSMIRADRITPALFMQFLTTLFMLYDPIRKLNRVNLVIQEAAAAGDRVASLMAIPNEVIDQPTAAPLEGIEKGVRYEDVSFAYGGDRPVLDRFTIEIAAGEVVALVGASGAGKSTVVNLLPRFFDPTGGMITIDGKNIRDLPLENLRSLIGLVTQETTLFNDTVRANIAYGRADLSLELVREAAAAAYADDFIMELPDQYETTIGESGAQLSGGQRQRLAIARALLKNAPMLILDEATSHLDTESEVLVQRAISNLMAGRTSLVIAHRLSTITRADRIIVLDAGQILESGTHEELLARGGPYKRLYDLQFRD